MKSPIHFGSVEAR